MTTTRTQSVSGSWAPSRTQYYRADIYYFATDSGITIRNPSEIRTNAAGVTYVDNMNYYLNVVANADMIISFTFTEFNTENCCDFFEIYDGASTASRQLLRASGSAIPGQVLTTGPYAYIRWMTDYSIVGTGVVAQMRFIIPPSPTSSATGSVTASITRTMTSSLSATVTISPTGSATASLTPTGSTSYIKLADSATEFSSSQSTQWTYGYYLGGSAGSRILFRSNEYSAGSATWIYGPNSWCRLSGSVMHPNSGGACSTPSYGYCVPSLIWTPSAQYSSFCKFIIIFRYYFCD